MINVLANLMVSPQTLFRTPLFSRISWQIHCILPFSKSLPVFEGIEIYDNKLQKVKDALRDTGDTGDTGNKGDTGDTWYTGETGGRHRGHRGHMGDSFKKLYKLKLLPTDWITRLSSRDASASENRRNSLYGLWKMMFRTSALYFSPYGVKKVQRPILWENIHRLDSFHVHYLGFITPIDFNRFLAFGDPTWSKNKLTSTWFASQVKLTGQPKAVGLIFADTAIINISNIISRGILPLWGYSRALDGQNKKIKELTENVTVFFKLSPKNKQGEHWK